MPIRTNYGYSCGQENGKSIMVSFPAHETHLIDELDRLAHLEMTTKSQFLRRCIRRESEKVEENAGKRFSRV